MDAMLEGCTRQGFGEIVRQLISSIDSCEVDCTLVCVQESKSEGVSCGPCFNWEHAIVLFKYSTAVSCDSLDDS